MLTFLFWNINKKQLQDIVAELAFLHEVDVLILAECDIASPTLLRGLNSKPGLQFYLTFSPSRRIVIYTRFPGKWIEPILDEEDWSIRHLDHPILDQKLLIVAAHLHSLMSHSKEDLNHLATRLRPHIEDAEEKVGHNRTVVVGDLNMNPFDSGVVSSEGLHGLMDRKEAEKQSRTVDGQTRRFFYNPMWSRIGDESVGPPGTYHYYSSSPISQFWHTYDQVLIRPDLLPYFRNEEMQVLTEVGVHSLVSHLGRPDARNASDHYPLLFRLTF